MSKVVIRKMNGEGAGELDIGAGVLVLDRGLQAVKDVVTARQNARRAGTASTKTKGTVAGSGKKPWKQKGTGRARAGYRSSPVWRGGGVAFGPKPRDYSQQVNRKVRILAFARAFSDRIEEGAVTVLDTLSVDAPKTRQVVALAKALGAQRRLLLVSTTIPETLKLAARNLPGVCLAVASDVEVFDVMNAEKIAVSREAWAQIETRLRAAGGRGE
jgi:large subunit ribosomal protein L4